MAWRRLEDVPPDARIWLLGVVRRVLANQRRGSARQRALHERVSAQTSALATSEPRDERLLRALAELRADDREALLLVAWEGLSHSEAAQVLGIRARTFGVRLHRARRRLAWALDCVDRGAESSIATEVT